MVRATAETSLLGRISEGRRGTRIEPDAAVSASVIRHLERLFNARQGGVAACPDYGLPDLTGLSNSQADTAHEFRRAINRAIDLFEPRLQGAKVRPDAPSDDPLRLHFRISATLVCKGVKCSVNISTRLEREGRFLVEE